MSIIIEAPTSAWALLAERKGGHHTVKKHTLELLVRHVAVGLVKC